MSWEKIEGIITFALVLCAAILGVFVIAGVALLGIMAMVITFGFGITAIVVTIVSFFLIRSAFRAFRKKRVLRGIVSIVILAIIACVMNYAFSWQAEREEWARASLYTLGEGGEKISLTIDGKIENAWDRFEWRKVTVYSYKRTRHMIVYLTNDDQDLYLAIRDFSDYINDGKRDYALFCFLLSEELKIEAGKFKTVKIFGDGLVLWQSWDKMEKLRARSVHQYEDYTEELKNRLGRNEAIRVYDGERIVGGEEGVYALFAYNMKDIPEGLIVRVGFQNHRIYEAKIPLSSLGIKPGQTIRIFGYTYDHSFGSEAHYPNMLTQKIACSFWYSEIVTWKVNE